MKNIFTKKIKIKDIYLILVIVLGLVMISLYSTYALFTGSVVSTEALANVNTDIHVDFDINSNKTFSLEANTIITFYANVNNHMDGPIHYELYHDLDSSVSNVIIAEVVSDPSVTTTAPNTKGTLEKGSKKTIPLVIENKSNDTVTVTIGLAIGYVGNEIEYGSGNYPSNVMIITNVYDDDKVPEESCASAGESIGKDYSVSYALKEKDGQMQTVKIIECPTDLSGASMPSLKDGMIPIKWDSSNNVVKADLMNPSNDIWYDYNNKIRANAVMVSESTRTSYMNAEVGTTIDESDILAYFVWIPRYKYVLFNTDSSVINPQEIEIEFESVSASKSTGSQNGSWLTHPAFTFGTKELSGIWVGKFETTGDADTPTIKPNLQSLRSQNVSTQFETAQKINSTTYVSSAGVRQMDAHMMKNTEWGAVVYLSHSKYGMMNEVCKNNSSAYYTGRSGGNVAGSIETIVEHYPESGSTSTYEYFTYGYYTYNDFSVEYDGTISTVKDNTVGKGTCASTTGNVYGVYDMSGGAWEYVMGVLADPEGNPRSGSDSKSNSGYNGLLNYRNSDGSYYFTSGKEWPDAKYYNLYTDRGYTNRILGDATGEVRSWIKTTPSLFMRLTRGSCAAALTLLAMELACFSFKLATVLRTAPLRSGWRLRLSHRNI